MKETRVYVIDTSETEETNLNEISDEQFMDIAEEQGSVYTLKAFETAFNRESVYTGLDFIRFIEVEYYGL